MAKVKKKIWIILSVVLAVCIAVGVTLAVVLPAGHKHPLEIHGGRPATCTADGNVLYWKCETCDKYFSDELGKHELQPSEIVVPAKGHKYANGVCTVCGYAELKGTNNLSFDEIKDENDKVIAYAFSGMGTSTDTELVIPATNNKLPVTHIAEGALKNNVQIVSVTIPSSVVTIGDGAFDGCTKLANILVDEYNTLFTSVSGNLYSKDKKIMLRYAPGKTETTFAVLGEVVTIVKGAFRDAINLENVTMPQESKCQEIEAFAFDGCVNLKTAKIASAVAVIGQGAFYNCGRLQELTLPFVGNLKYVGTNSQYPFGYVFGSYAYDGGVATKQIFHGSSSDVTTEQIYYVPASLKTVMVTGGNLCYGAFSNCVNLDNVILDGVSSVASHAFENCNLTEVYVSDSVKEVGEYAFIRCRALTIRCQASEKPADWNVHWNFYANPVVWNCNEKNVADDGNVYVVSGGLRFALKTSATVVAQPQNLSGDIVIPASIDYDGKTYAVTAVASNAFDGCEQMETVTIPQTVTAVGQHAFANCQFIVIYCEATAMPSGWNEDFNSDGYPIVWNCKESQVADDGYTYVTYTGMRYGLKDGKATVAKQSLSVATAEIPASIRFDGTDYAVTAIADGAFANSSLVKVTIPASVTSIGAGAFENCKYLTDITLPQTVIVVAANAFWGCDALTIRCQAVVKPAGFADGWRSVSQNSDCPVVWRCDDNDVATDGYTYLVLNGVRYALKDGAATVARQSLALSGDVQLLSTVSYKKTTYVVNAIADYAFNNCAGVQSVQIPVSVQSVGIYAFAGCTSLVSAVLPEGIKQIETGCFAQCINLESFTIPSSVLTIKFNVFADCSKLVTVSFAEGSKCTAIGSGAFLNCTSLLRITLPQTVTSIGKQAFLHCNSLKYVNFRNTQGWWYAASSTAISGTKVDAAVLSDPQQAASELVKNCDYYWKRAEVSE